MEVGPELCFWTDSSTELNKAPLLTFTQPSHVNHTRPYMGHGLAGVVLELESDSELDEDSSRRWNEEIIKVTGEDLIELEPSSPVALDRLHPESVKCVNVIRPHTHCTASSPTSSSSGPVETASPAILAQSISSSLNESASGQSTVNTTPATTMDSDNEAGKSTSNESTGQLEQTRQHVVFPNQTSVNCPLCERTFVNFRSRNIHMNKTHSVKTNPSGRQSSRKVPTTPLTVDTATETLSPTHSSPTGLASVQSLPQSNSSPHPTVTEDSAQSAPAESSISDCQLASAPKDLVTEPNNPGQKSRPVYTVSSPPPGSPSKIALHEIVVVSLAHSISSTETSLDHTPEPNPTTGSNTESHSTMDSECTEPARQVSITGHYKSHYNATQKPYMCEDCGQRYTSPSNLHYHRARSCPVLKLKASQLNQALGVNEDTGSKSDKSTVTVNSQRSTPNTRVGKRANPFIWKQPSVPCQSGAQMTMRIDQKAADQSHELSRSADTSVFTAPSKKARSTRRANSLLAAPCPPTDTYFTKPLCSAVFNQLENTNSTELSTRFPEKSKSDETAASTIQAQLQQVIEQACQSEELRQKILTLTSAAIVSALSPLASDRSHHLQTFVEELVRLTRLAELNNSPQSTRTTTTTEHRPHSFSSPSSSESNPSHLATSTDPNRHNAEVGLSSTDREQLGAQLNRQHIPVSTPIRTHGPGSVQKNIWEFRDDHSEASAGGGTSTNSQSTETSKTAYSQIALSQHLDALFSGIVSSSATSKTTNVIARSVSSPTPQSSRMSRSRADSRPAIPVQCPECDRCFSSHAACRVHVTKSHQNSRSGAGGQATGINLAGNTLLKSNWREVCPR
ncbi:unnamed protein product [Echinostoma caproni]|uniref:C2H2-type domain-containing protein n=1 Tax=Echinostoma caproni TaxID=27848 RepID=A0A183AWK9_9TREM|nr:unnamed protein product [Echinostoma caproni]